MNNKICLFFYHAKMVKKKEFFFWFFFANVACRANKESLHLQSGFEIERSGKLVIRKTDSERGAEEFNIKEFNIWC